MTNERMISIRNFESLDLWTLYEYNAELLIFHFLLSQFLLGTGKAVQASVWIMTVLSFSVLIFDDFLVFLLNIIPASI